MPLYRGVVQGNVIVLEKNVKLPNGLQVLIEVAKSDTGTANYAQDPFLNVDSWLPPCSDNLPQDLASRHDYYLYEEGQGE